MVWPKPAADGECWFCRTETAILNLSAVTLTPALWPRAGSCSRACTMKATSPEVSRGAGADQQIPGTCFHDPTCTFALDSRPLKLAQPGDRFQSLLADRSTLCHILDHHHKKTSQHDAKKQNRHSMSGHVAAAPLFCLQSKWMALVIFSSDKVTSAFRVSTGRAHIHPWFSWSLFEWTRRALRDVSPCTHRCEPVCFICTKQTNLSLRACLSTSDMPATFASPE